MRVFDLSLHHWFWCSWLSWFCDSLSSIVSWLWCRLKYFSSTDRFAIGFTGFDSVCGLREVPFIYFLSYFGDSISSGQNSGIILFNNFFYLMFQLSSQNSSSVSNFSVIDRHFPEFIFGTMQKDRFIHSKLISFDHLDIFPDLFNLFHYYIILKVQFVNIDRWAFFDVATLL